MNYLKIHPFVATFAIAGALILLFVLFRGCRQSKLEVAAKEKAQLIADSVSGVLAKYKVQSDSTAKEFQDSLDFERGQKELIKAQKERTEDELARLQPQIKDLLDKHRLAQYQDTTAVTVPQEYIADCEGCFTKLQQQTDLVTRYKVDINNLEASTERQNQIYQKRFKELDQEKLGFYNKINSLAQQQQKALDKLKPHGRLYLSWGVIWGVVPIGAGAGLMYQNKYNLIWGAKWYYTKYGHQVETTINFPLSLKFK